MAAVPILLTGGFYAALIWLGFDPESTQAFDVLFWCWIGGSIGFAIATGAVAGPGRGTVATFLVWAAVSLLLSALFGTGCPLDLGSAPHVHAGLAYLGPTDQCSDGRDASTYGGLQQFTVIAGAPLTVIAGVSGVVANAARRVRRRHATRRAAG
ncbi:MAG: hypothetical protein AAGC46_13970 [Solirubrobacteraceae bacterium]|nr:hypothetical protein [Patulibacter sp.]